MPDVTVGNTATLVRAGNGNRVALYCTNTDAAVHVRWGGANTVTATRGQRVPASRAIAITYLGDVFMISEGANVVVACTEELR